MLETSTLNFLVLDLLGFDFFSADLLGVNHARKQGLLWNGVIIFALSGFACAAPGSVAAQQDIRAVPCSEATSRHGVNVFSDKIYISLLLEYLPSDQALCSIIHAPDSYTLSDIYYVLWSIARDNHLPDLQRILLDSASLSQFYLNKGHIHPYHPMDNTAQWDELMESLTLISQALSREQKDLNLLVYYACGILYKLIEWHTMLQIRQQVSLCSDTHTSATSQLLTFLYEMSLLCSRPNNSAAFFEGNPQGYASRRVWYFFNREMRQRTQRPPEAHVLHVIRVATLSCYMLFLGYDKEAYRMLGRLAETESRYMSEVGYASKGIFIDRVINSTLRVIDEQGGSDMRHSFLRMLAFLITYPHFKDAPDAIVALGRVDVLRQVQKVLATKVNDSLIGFNSHPEQEMTLLVRRIQNEEEFEQFIIKPLSKEQKKVQHRIKKRKRKLPNPMHMKSYIGRPFRSWYQRHNPKEQKSAALSQPFIMAVWRAL